MLSKMRTSWLSRYDADDTSTSSSSNSIGIGVVVVFFVAMDVMLEGAWLNTTRLFVVLLCRY